MTKEPTAKGKMHVNPGSPPGIEVDSKGNPIPLSQRTEQDQAVAIAAGSIKNPESELEHPAPMPRQQQGQGGTPKQNDLAGQQGGQRK